MGKKPNVSMDYNNFGAMGNLFYDSAMAHVVLHRQIKE